MKFGVLKSIGHNIADSLASGIGLMIGHFETDVFGEAASSSEGYIVVDFIAGTTSGAQPSDKLAEAIALYAKALNDLCLQHGASADAFQELTVRYSQDWYGGRFVVTVQNQNGRRSTDEYLGAPGERVMELDNLGRIRPKRHQTL